MISVITTVGYFPQDKLSPWAQRAWLSSNLFLPKSIRKRKRNLLIRINNSQNLLVLMVRNPLWSQLNITQSRQCNLTKKTMPLKRWVNQNCNKMIADQTHHLRMKWKTCQSSQPKDNTTKLRDQTIYVRTLQLDSKITLRYSKVCLTITKTLKQLRLKEDTLWSSLDTPPQVRVSRFN